MEEENRSSHQNRRTQELASCRNLGPKSVEMLKKAGISSPSQLAELGAVQAFLCVKKAGCKPSLNINISLLIKDKINKRTSLLTLLSP